MTDSLDQILLDRARIAYNELSGACDEGFMKEDTSLNTKMSSDTVNDFETMLSQCKNSLKTDKEAIAQELKTLYNYDPKAETLPDIQKTTKLFCENFFTLSESDIVLNDLYYERYYEDMKLIETILDAFEKRIDYYQSKKYLLFFKGKKALLNQHKEEHAKFLMLKNCLEVTLSKLQQRTASIIVKNFSHFYAFFFYIIHYFQTTDNLYVLIEAASMIENLKKRLQPPLKNFTLKKEQLKSNYALAELSALQHAITSQI